MVKILSYGVSTVRGQSQVNAPHLVSLVRAGVPFTNGKQVERPDQSNTEPNAA